MRLIYRTKLFEKSFNKLKRSGKATLSTKKKLEEVVGSLAVGKKLSKTQKDHKLQGDLKAYRECHVKGDLLLIYQIDKKVLILVNIDTHSQIFK